MVFPFASANSSWNALLDEVILGLQSLNWPLIGSAFAQVLFLVFIIYFIYNRFIRRSHAEQLLKGLFVTLLVIVSSFFVARALHASFLENVFGVSIQLLIIGLIVIFQPELRKMLLFLGQPELFGRQSSPMSSEERKAEYLIHELVEALRFLSKFKTGALIVLESPSNPGGSYLEAGTPLDARLSTELLLTIFHPNTPLHDGAVVINNKNRLTAAGVLLPLTEDPKLSWQYGTRHRAAIGLSEVSDSQCLVVSEETGTISFVRGGILEKIAGPDELKRRLEQLYHVHSEPDSEKKGPALSERFAEFLTTDILPESLQKIFNRRDENLNPSADSPQYSTKD